LIKDYNSLEVFPPNKFANNSRKQFEKRAIKEISKEVHLH